MDLQEFVGCDVGLDQLASEPVNVAMVRQWCEAMGDSNPVYLDRTAASESVFGGVVAPPTMLQAWVMRPYRADHGPDRDASGPNPYRTMTELIESAGFTAVVATNCEQVYDRYLRPGDLLTMRTTIEAISAEKSTALGTGHFITTRQDYFDADGERVGTMLFRIFRFRPGLAAASATEARAPQILAHRPRPAITHDQRFWFEGLREGKLSIQRCTGCGALRHPPGPMCRRCRSVEWDTVEASGGGSIHSFTVVHHPQVDGIEYPNQVVLVDLDEGVRLVANTTNTTYEQLRIGARVKLHVQHCDDDLSLPFFEVVP